MVYFWVKFLKLGSITRDQMGIKTLDGCKIKAAANYLIEMSIE